MQTRFPILCVLVAAALLAGAVAATAQPAGRALQLADERERSLEQAVVYITVEYSKPNSTRRSVESGTGFFVTPTHLVTNQHVISAALGNASAAITVRILSGTRESRQLPAEIVATDRAADLALLTVKGDLPPLEPVRISPDLMGKQTEVFAFGFPLGTMLDQSVNGPNVCLRRGYVSRLINDGKNIEADLNIDKGISGGPLVDSEGVVRGVVRAMAGSDFNKGFAAIAVSSPVLLDFCSTHGLTVTLPDGKTLEPKQQTAVASLAPTTEPAPRPLATLDEDAPRAFFAIGSALRLNSLVPGILVLEKAEYTPDLRQTSKTNADQALANLQRVRAPAELLQRARELSRLLAETQTLPATAREKSAVLEEACDEWTREVAERERLNYDLGSWLTELSLGVLDPDNHKDSRYCAYFLDAARRAQATPEIIQTLTRIQTNLTAYEQSRGDEVRRAIGKDADRLLGIGVLATEASGMDPLQKAVPPPSTAPAPRNPIRYPL
ncbi:serine protease [bacterium]|nr:serine protease [bacterium]